MSPYNAAGFYWYEFQFKGRRIQESTHTGNKDAARQIEVRGARAPAD